ncbi:MAG: DUF1638 domain-containing protein [Rhizobiaceae bacterium]
MSTRKKRQNGEIRTQKVRIIACGMIAREVLAVKERHGLENLDLVCLPAQFHYYPDRIAPAMEEAIQQAKEEGVEHILAGYADCGTGGHLDLVCEKYGIDRIDGPHCFAFYQGMKSYEQVADEDMTAFYMTDFLCRQFDAFFMKPLGLDKHPELASDYFGHYEKLVYLAQTDDPSLDQVAEDAARMLGLRYERRYTGYGDLTTSLLAATATP